MKIELHPSEIKRKIFFSVDLNLAKPIHYTFI